MTQPYRIPADLACLFDQLFHIYGEVAASVYLFNKFSTVHFHDRIRGYSLSLDEPNVGVLGCISIAKKYSLRALKNIA